MEMNSELFKQEVEESKLPVLVEFFSDSCTYWHVLDPEMDQMKASFAGELKVLKINADTSQEVAQKYNIDKFPTLVLFRDGGVVWRYSGLIMVTQLMNVLEDRVGLSLSE